jgi:hypothetical protein
MGNLPAAGVGAIASLVVVGIGALLQGRRERRHWLRDQKLKAAVDFLTATRYLLNQYRRIGAPNMVEEHRREWRAKMQSARSALVLLCSTPVVQRADEVATRLQQMTPDTDAQVAAATDDAFLRLISDLRREINR